jgi:flagellar basal-body rod modification protein FlgD
MAINDIAPLDVRTSGDAAAPVQAHGSNKLGKDQFLQLLMAQLSHQDPTSPADGNAFVAQLAQFASLEMMQNANSNLESLLAGQAAGNQTSALGLVGKEVLFRTDQLTLAAGTATATSARLAAPAQQVTAVVTDGNGKVVRTMQLGAAPEGSVDVVWDGRDDQGAAQPDGHYTIRVTAADQSGKTVDVEQRSSGAVTGVSFENGVPELLLGEQRLKLSAVVQVNERNTP